jgi:SAM-dependent methyltransferase
MAPWSDSTTEIALGTYEELAPEYYDTTRHPTCANFREATRIALRPLLKTAQLGSKSLCEVGAGKSILVEELIYQGLPTENVTLIDSSVSMLRHSMLFRGNQVHSSVGDATQLDMKSNSVDFMVSCLGDPYNLPLFWEEVHRVLRPGGSIFYSTPSFEWAHAFRIKQNHASCAAMFELRDGRQIFLPSFVYPVKEQIKLIEQNRLRVAHIQGIPISELRNQTLSPKLLLERGPDASIVTIYIATKTSDHDPNSKYGS